MFKEFLGTMGAIVTAIAIGISVAVGVSVIGYELYDYLAPKYRATDMKVFKESEQYNDGMIRDLENLQMEYIKANADQKQLLKSIIIHRFEVYDQNRLPANLWNFYQDVKEGKL